MTVNILGAAAASAYFMIFQLCGILCAFCFLPGEHKGIRLVFGSTAGTVMLQWFPSLFSFFFGFTLLSHYCAAGAAAVIILVLSLLSLRKKMRGKLYIFQGEGIFKGLLRHKFLIFAFVLWGFYCFLVFNSFRYEDGKVFSSQATYGDMNMHLGFITSIAKQQTFPPYYSILPDTMLSYPFLSDSVSSSLYLFGCSLRFAYMLPMWFAGGQVMLGFYLLALRLLKGNKLLSAGAFVLFFLNGGLGVVYFLPGGEYNFSRMLSAFYETPTNLAGEGIRWVNVIVDMMLPQRATLFGWAVLFPLIYLLHSAVFCGKKEYFLLCGIFAGALPMIHTHSFLVFALICGVWLIYSLLSALGFWEKAVRIGKILVPAGLLFMTVLKAVLDALDAIDTPLLLIFAAVIVVAVLGLTAWMLVILIKRDGAKFILSAWGILLIVALCLAVPQLIFWTFRQAAGSSSFVRGHFGWIMGEENYLLFYLKNIGICGILILGGLLTAKADSFARYSPALVIWFIGETVVFQPNVYDNNKLLYVSYAFLCCAAAEFAAVLLKKIKKKHLKAAAAVCLTVLCTVSAVLTMVREAVAKYELYGMGALRLCEYVDSNIPEDAVILTDVRHNNEIAAFTGRNVVCGSPSYLFYHGLNYQARQQAVQLMYEAPEENIRLFEQFGVDYILVSSFERSSYKVDFGGLSRLFTRIYNDSSRSIYVVSEKETS